MKAPSSISPRATFIFVSVAAMFASSVLASPFSGEAVGTGRIVARFSGLEISATLSGGIEWTGEAVLGDEVVRFSAQGTFSGVGLRGIVSMISEGWIGYSASGSTASGESIEIRGLLHLRWKSVIALKAGDPVVGSQYTVLLFGGRAQAFAGEFTGSAQGQLEPADVPLTIQLGGTGVVQLTGEPMAWTGKLPESIPIDHPALSLEFLDYLHQLLSPGDPEAVEGIAETPSEDP